jgi:hypothetical protein
MVSFYDLLEKLNNFSQDDELNNRKSLQVIRNGNDLHKDEDRSFWDEFIELCSNSEGMAELLEIDGAKVSSWPSKIRKLIEKTKEVDQKSGNSEIEKRVIPTGDNGSITMGLTSG